MNQQTQIIVVVVSLIIAIPVSRILVNQLGKVFAAGFKPYLFLILALIPAYDMIHLIISAENFYRLVYFYFWVIFFISLVVQFIYEKYYTSQKTNSTE